MKAAAIAKSLLPRLSRESAPAAGGDHVMARICEAERIGYGVCALSRAHPGWHRTSSGVEWPQRTVDRDLDAILNGPALPDARDRAARDWRLMAGACWADPLSDDGTPHDRRRAGQRLQTLLGRRHATRVRSLTGALAAAGGVFVDISAEMSDLRMDVTERAEAAR